VAVDDVIISRPFGYSDGDADGDWNDDEILSLAHDELRHNLSMRKPLQRDSGSERTKADALHIVKLKLLAVSIVDPVTLLPPMSDVSHGRRRATFRHSLPQIESCSEIRVCVYDTRQ
jgi:hypothetical protein